MEGPPLAVHILLDKSGSMRRVHDLAIEVVNAFIDRLNLCNHPATVTVATFSVNIGVIIEAVPAYCLPRLTDDTYKTGGGTYLSRAVIGQLATLAAETARRKALVVICDGGDDDFGLRDKARAAIAKAEADGIAVFYLAIGDQATKAAKDLCIDPDKLIVADYDNFAAKMDEAGAAVLDLQHAA